MIFIYEPQYDIDPKCLDEYKTCYPLREALNQYSFLYTLDNELIEDISSIHFVYKKGFEPKLYKKLLSQYSPDISSYTDPKLLSKIFELCLLPNYDNLKDKSKQAAIVGLIQRQKFIEFNSVNSFIKDKVQNNKIIIYLPFKRETTQALIQNVPDEQKLRLFTSCGEMKSLANTETVELEPKLYFDICKKLKTISEEKVEEFTATQYYFEPKPLLQIFNNTFYNTLSSIFKSEVRKVQVLGDNKFLANRTINFILQSCTPYYYDLLEGVPKITKKNEPSVFFNFDILESADDFVKLFESTKDIITYIVLQSAKNIVNPYFRQYYKIELPNRILVKQAITKIVIALLCERGIISSEFYKIYPMIKNNSFLSLLKDFGNLESLYLAIGKLQKISAAELLSKADIWYFIIDEMRKIENGNIEYQPNKHRRKVIFENSDLNWSISGIGKPLIFDYSKTIGIKYLAIIIFHQKLFHKPIDASLLRIIARDLDNEESSEFKINRDPYTDSKAIVEGLKKPKSIPAMKDFCDNYIKHIKSEFWFDSKNEIECEIIYPKLTQSIFESYYA